MQTVHFRNWLKWIQTKVPVTIKQCDGRDITPSTYPSNNNIAYAVTNCAPINGLNKWISNGIPGSWGCGVIFGDGNTSPTENDYFLSGNPINTLSVTPAVTTSTENDKIIVKGIFTITNTSDSEVTIREVGVFGSVYNGNSIIAILTDRTVLDTPLTIPAGGIGQVVYKVAVS